MEYDLSKEIFTYEKGVDFPYNQPISMRQYLGFIGYLNDFISKPIETLHVETTSENDVLALFFNCKSESIKDVLSQKLSKDISEFSFS